MVFRPLSLLPPCRKTCSILHLMQKNVTVLCLLCYDFQRRGISADNDDPIRCSKLKAIAFQCAVADRKCLYSDTVILVNDAGLNFLCIYFIALFICLLKTIDPKINIYRIGFLNTGQSSHGLPLGPKTLTVLCRSSTHGVKIRSA